MDDTSGGLSKEEEYYYLKFSHTEEKPNHFVERSLPFFVPTTVAGNGTNDNDSSRSNNNNNNDKNKSPRPRPMWETFAEMPISTGLLGKTGRREGKTKAASTMTTDTGAGGGMGVNIFMRNSRAWKGIHCRMGMDGVSHVARGIRHLNQRHKLCKLKSSRWLFTLQRRCCTTMATIVMCNCYCIIFTLPPKGLG